MSEIPITVFGNVVSDVRSISTRTGATLSSFRMAVNNRKFSKTTNTWIDLDTTYLTVNCWRQLGDHVLVSVKRGDPVLVAGRLRVRDWSTEDKSGTVVEVEAMSVGHDLSRGTATFSRFKREQAEAVLTESTNCTSTAKPHCPQARCSDGSCSDSTTHGPAIRKKRCSMPTSKPHSFMPRLSVWDGCPGGPTRHGCRR